MVPLNGVAGSGAIRKVARCAGPDALGGAMTAAAHPGRVYPPFELTEEQVIPPGGAQGFVYTPASPPVAAFEYFEFNSAFNPTTFKGVANDGGIFGLTSTVNLDNDHIRAHWRFTVDSEDPICAAMVGTFGSIPSPEGGYTGHPFNAETGTNSYYLLNLEADGAEIVSGSAWNAGVLPGSFDSLAWVSFRPTRATEWDLVLDVTLGVGGFGGFHYMGGINFTSFLLFTTNYSGLYVPGSGSRQ